MEDFWGRKCMTETFITHSDVYHKQELNNKNNKDERYKVIRNLEKNLDL